MIEENKVWKHFAGYKNIEADPDSIVVLLHETKDGWRCLDTARRGKRRWCSDHDIPERKVIGYYEVEIDDYIRCRHIVTEPIESMPLDFKGAALVLWEFGRDTIDGYKPDDGEFYKLSDVRNGRVHYVLEHEGMSGPSYIIGYHILPDRFFAKFEDGIEIKMDYDPNRLYEQPKRKIRDSIEIKRQKDDSLIVIVRKDGQRTTLPFDSPDLDIYRPGLDWMKEQMLSMNAGSAKISC